MIFSSDTRHHRSWGFFRRRSRDAEVSSDVRDNDGRALSVPEPAPFGSVVGDRVCLDADDLDRLLWKDTRELDVVGRGGGVDGRSSWDRPRGESFVDVEAPDSDGDDADADADELRPLGSRSGVLRADRCGLGARDGLALVARLWA